MANSLIEAVFFDLDGTLADTAPDLCGALNRLLSEEGRPKLPLEKARPYTSNGTRGLLAIGFDIVPTDVGYADLVRRFLKHYENALWSHTVLFPEIGELLAGLEERSIPWGVVTNKPQRFTLPLLEGLGLRRRCACIVSGDSAPHPKPHPAPLLLACVAAQALPSRSLFVGDDQRDIVAGHAAGMITVAAAYGYLGVDVPIHSWQAHAIVNRPNEVLGLLDIA
jgi:phosphoglycolate phosphatase